MPSSPTLDETGAYRSTTAAPVLQDPANKMTIGTEVPIERDFNDVMIRLSRIGDRLRHLDKSRWSTKTDERPLCIMPTYQSDQVSWQQGHSYEQSSDLSHSLNLASPKSSTTSVLASAASSSNAVPISRSPTLSFTPTLPFSTHDRMDLKISFGEPSEEECEQELSTLEKIISRLTRIKPNNLSQLNSEDSRDSSLSRCDQNKVKDYDGVLRTSNMEGEIESITRRLESWQPLEPTSKNKDLIQKVEPDSDLQGTLLMHKNEDFCCAERSIPFTKIPVLSDGRFRQVQLHELGQLPKERTVQLKVRRSTGEMIKEKLLTQSDQPDKFQAHVYFTYKRAGDIVPNLVFHLPKNWTFLKLVRKSLAEIQRKTFEHDATNILWVHRYHPNRNLRKIKENIRIIFGEKGVSFRGSNLKKEIGPYLTKFINKFWLQERRD